MTRLPRTPNPPPGPASHAAYPPPALGSPAMRALFNFAPGYRPLNHGSYGTFPRCVLEFRQQLERDFEARPDTYKRFVFPRLLREARTLVAPFLGAAVDEVVFVPNATTGVNVVLRNLRWEVGDVVLLPSSVYPACRNTVQAVAETAPLEIRWVELTYPLEDEEVLDAWRAAVETVRTEGKRVRLALFDTIVSGPGVCVPWEGLTKLCKEYGILSLIDAAHGIGQIDMEHVGKLKPDFLVTNCHKWLYVPRGAAVFYVPFHNQPLITTGLPTSHGYRAPARRAQIPPAAYFVDNFLDTATADYSPFTSVPAALRFRADVCGGEAAIRDYCLRLALQGGDCVAAILGTDVLRNHSGSINRCFLVNVRLPLTVVPAGGSLADGDVSAEEAPRAMAWMQETAAWDYDTYFQVGYYEPAGYCLVRLSAQIYLSVDDFAWGAGVLQKMCDRVKDGSWKKDEGKERDWISCLWK